MQTRRLGQQLDVTAIGLGCMGMSTAYAGAGDDASRKTLRTAVDLGVQMFDTADAYGPYTNEVLLGQVLGDVRDQITIATKFANEFLDDGGVRINGRPEYVATACDASLQRLGLDVIDLYYQHRVDPDVPIEETVGAMGELVTAGKVRHLGLSEASADTIRRAHATHPIAAVQTEYSLWTRDVEDEVLPTMRELGIGLVPYSPLGRGFLTGAIRSRDDLDADDWRRSNPRFEADNLDHNLAIVEAVEAAAAERGCTPGQLALAWVLAQGDDIVPIPGTTRPAHLRENVGATDVALTPTEADALARATPPPSGARYDQAGLSRVGL